MIKKTVFVRNYSMYLMIFPKCHMESPLGYFNANVGGTNILKLTIGNESLHQDINDNGVKIINFATSKIWLLRARWFHNKNVLNYT